MAGSKRKPLTQRFARFVQQGDPSACWLWSGTQSGSGYGMVWADGTMVNAHRVAWQLAHGPIPPSMCVLHVCDTKLCVNPSHLVLGTLLANNLDKLRKGRQAKGERSSTAILSAAQIPAIRRSSETCEALAARLGVTFSTIRRVKRRITWRHIP